MFGAQHFIPFSRRIYQSHTEPLYKMNPDDDADCCLAQFKVVLLGSSGVGKSALMRRICLKPFQENTKATIGLDFLVRVIKVINGPRIRLMIWDTAGQEAFHAITHQMLRGTHVFLIVFDLTQRSTFDDVMNRHLQDIPDDAVVVMLGNKRDLADLRQVRVDDANAYCHARGISYIETSARDGSNINIMLDLVGTELYTKHKQMVRACEEKRKETSIRGIKLDTPQPPVFIDVQSPPPPLPSGCGC